MKKIFLIPLLACFSCVMAWADNVARIGETEYATVDEAIADAENGATITLLADAGGDVTLSKNITLNGDKKFTGNITIGASEVTLTLAGVTIDVTGNDAIVHVGKTLNVIVAEGTTNAVYAKSKGCDCFYGTSNGHLNISGNGTLDVYGLEALHVSYMNLSAPNATYGASKTLMYEPHIVSATISAGTFDREFSDSYVSAPLFIEKVSSSYVVSNIGANVAVCNYTAYASLQAAVDAAVDGDAIYLYADAEAVTVSKQISIHYGTYSVANVSAGSGYTQMSAGANAIKFVDNNVTDLINFLAAEGTNSLTISADINISNAGSLHVKGNKTLTINEGVKVLYKRQSAGANIIVDNGAKLTLLGSGTFQPAGGTDIETNSVATNQVGNRAIDVDGELIVGVKDDADNCPRFITTSLARGSAVTTNADGVATFNNAYVHAASAALWNEGKLTVNGGEYVSVATSENGIDNANWYSYAFRIADNSRFVMNGGHVVGVHGGIAVYEYANANIYGGTIESVHGKNFSTGADNTKDNYYALYVARRAIVNVYDGNFKVELPSKNSGYALYISDDDSHTSFGLIYMYGGLYSEKMYVGKRKPQDDEILFPVLISTESDWYKVTENGGYGPTPDGYEYREIISEGEPTETQVLDAAAYAEGYRYKVVCLSTSTKEVDENATTIPWQQSSTWNASASSESTAEVPTEATVVTIPEGKTVVISADDNENNGVTEAKAEQIFLGDGASLTVQTGTTLTVGDGGVNIANGGQLVVEPGAIVTVGATGLVSTEDEALVIEATEEDQGVFLLNPSVTENTQPKATVKLVTKCKQVAANEFIWERFAIPTLDGEATTYGNERLDTVHYYDGSSSLQEGLYEWSYATQDWVGVSRWKNLKPFVGYQLTNNSKYGNVVYTFEGNLVGNNNQNYQFAQSGFGFFGNSYTGDIDILKFFESFGENMQKTIWIYDYYADAFKAITEANYGTVYYGTRKDRHEFITDIRSMQAFIMNTFAEGESNTTVNYQNAIWGNPKYNLPVTPAPKRVAANEDRFTVYVAGQKQEDEVSFIRNNAYSAAFDNGADASKWMNNGLNLYVTTENGDMAAVASDEIVNMTIAFRSGKETEYTLGFDNLNGEQYSLRDVLTGQVIKMTEGATYTFSQEANTTVPARFQIVAADKVTTNIEDLENAASVQQKVLKNGTLYILRDNKWYTVQGQNVR